MATSFSLSNLGNSTLTLSSGQLAKLANGSTVISYGDTVVLATACMSKEPKPGVGFFPLLVDYQERTYAMGKIPGGYIKREGRPKDAEVLTSRLIDRPLRPLFPKGLTNEVQIVAMVLSSDGKNDPDVLAINGASSALYISDIPFDNPVGAVRISKKGGEFILNPTYEEREDAAIDLVVVGTEEKIVMLEGQLNQTSEAEVLGAIGFAHPFIRQIIELQKKLKQEVGKPKKQVELSKIDENILKRVNEHVKSKLEDIYGIVMKEEREKALGDLLTGLYEEMVEEDPEITLGELKTVFFYIEEEFVRKKILEEEKRPDGRGLKDVRAIDCDVHALVRTHGSAIFTRGQTQSLAITTLGTSGDEQFIEALEGKKSKHFMLHYTFPPFSVGEIKFLRGPSRRDIGHGTLAEKSLSSVIPSKEEFPYTIRVVSEILESNGSSSMASVCAASLSLMDAGVPVKGPVAGIAIGLVTGEKGHKILTDIAGVEDHYGDMDFKIAGTSEGITTIQLDVKVAGIDYQIIDEALQRGKEVRLTILDIMNKALSVPREAVSEYAPKIRSIKIDPDKIGSIIGPGGKIIRRLSRENNVTIDIDDETSVVSVVAEREEDLERASKQVISLTKDIEAGEIFEGKITRIANFGAFAEIVPGKNGLIHVSEISDEYVKDVTQHLKEGDVVTVKVIGIDAQGRINLSIKQAK